MTNDGPAAESARFLSLIGPLHAAARRTARRLCRSNEEGDDLFQEAALRALQQLHTLRDPALFRPWFYQVLLSVHRNRARGAFWRRFVALPWPVRSTATEPTTRGLEGREEERWRARRLAEALALLPAEQREAVVLFELEELSLEEVAALQQASLSAVKTRLARGRERLRRHYQRLLERTAHEEAGAAVAASETGRGT